METATRRQTSYAAGPRLLQSEGDPGCVASDRGISPATRDRCHRRPRRVALWVVDRRARPRAFNARRYALARRLLPAQSRSAADASLNGRITTITSDALDVPKSAEQPPAISVYDAEQQSPSRITQSAISSSRREARDHRQTAPSWSGVDWSNAVVIA